MTDSEQQRHDLFLRIYAEHEESLRGFVRSLEDPREVRQEVVIIREKKFGADSVYGSMA